MSESTGSTVYSATYSNVPVYELQLQGDHFVMRRRSDNYINATHILKAADLDKPARTRVLEKEVQLGTHEKVQGGYGKYQGTWIPLEAGIDLAKKYAVFPLIKPLFDYVAGAQSPPPAPKHTTASSGRRPAKAKAQAQQAQQAQQAKSAPHHQFMQTQMDMNVEGAYDFDDGAAVHADDDYDNTTIASASFIDEDDGVDTDEPRKRRRLSDEERRTMENGHRVWADSLLDYYVVAGTDTSHAQEYAPPPPPSGVNVNMHIDNEAHSALHWAAAMGDTDYVKDLLTRHGANALQGNVRGETPLIKCSVFANCFDRGTYRRMIDLLGHSIHVPDKYGATVLHHIAKSALANAKGNRASHYLDAVLDKLSELLDHQSFFEFVNERDQAGDTAFHIVVRASHRCTRLLQARGIPADVPNGSGETVEAMLRDKMAKRAAARAASRTHHNQHRESNNIVASSSPVQPSSPMIHLDGASSPVPGGRLGDAPLSTSMLSTKSSQSFKKSIHSFYNTAVSNFMQVGEEELRAKDQLLVDIEAHLSRVNAKLIATQHESELLESERVDPSDDEALLTSKLASLTKDAQAYSEQMQHRFLHQTIRELESKASVDQDKEAKAGSAAAGGSNGTANQPSDAELAKRIHIARLLVEQQDERRTLTAKLVEAQSRAGMGELGEMGIRVLMKALGVKKEQIPSVVPEMIDNIELLAKDPGSTKTSL